MIKIVNAASWVSRRRFYSFSYELYREDDKWREPPVWNGRKVLSASDNRLLRHPHAFLMAIEDESGKILARMLTGIVGRRGYFSMFDAVPDVNAVRLLLDGAINWQRLHGAETLVGPVSPVEIDLGGGVLCEGFDEPAAMHDAYNAPYYDELLEKCGCEVCSEMLVYRIELKRFDGDRYRRVSEWAKERFGYEVRHELACRPRKLAADICSVMGEGAACEQMNRLIGAVAGDLVEGMCPVVYTCGAPVGFLLTLGKENGRARITTMWIAEGWRKKGVAPVLFDAAAEAMARLGMDEIDVSYIRSDNRLSRLGVENAGGRVKRRYRQYEIHV